MLHRCRPAGRLFYLVLAIVSLVIDTGLEGFAAAPRKSPSSVAAKPVADPTPARLHRRLHRLPLRRAARQ